MPVNLAPYRAIVAVLNNFLKASLLRSYLTTNKVDVAFISETHLNSSTLSNDDNLDLPGYIIL